MGEITREWLENKFDTLHERISEMKDEHAVFNKQTAVQLAEMETNQEHHAKVITDLQVKHCPCVEDVKDIKNQMWKVAGAAIMSLLGVAWAQLKVLK